jgi:hypothetical protein
VRLLFVENTKKNRTTTKQNTITNKQQKHTPKKKNTPVY